ncbi:MAG TPA: MBOAT family O-acyltransferase [Candidatus Methylomirabilis sp.]|nr:MBOAT family O-acyltransferase [Candidatus Methylomirabilis sp.]
MLFPSHLFLFGFLPVVVAVYWVLAPRARRWWLLAASAVFYGWADWRFLLLLGGMTALSFLATTHLMGRESLAARRLGLALALGNLVILGVFKYYDLFATTLDALATRNGLEPMASVLHLALPLGISFYTFNLLSYSLDVYRQRAAPASSLPDLLRYASFFPTVTSGPLMRWSDFSAQMETDGRPEAARIEQGVFSFSLGLGKKLVIADWIAQVIDPLWANPAALGVWGAWLAVVGYHFRLYFDFSGYCDMAVGLGHFLGIQVPANFRAPYTARTITEFWHRWHITLSTWFRDYLFFPLTRFLLRRAGDRYTAWTRPLSLVLTMSLTGFWHGPSWTYLVWGTYQGVLLAIHAQTRSRRRPWPAWVGRSFTTLALLLGWGLFRSGSMSMAGSLYASMFGLRGWGPAPTSILGVDAGFLLLLAGLFILTNLPRDVPDLRPRREWGYAVALGAFLVIALLCVGQPSPFLYFQF